MSRSIHETHASLWHKSKEVHKDKARHAEAMDEHRAQIAKKRRIKDSVRQDRRPHTRPAAHVSPTTIPVVVQDVGPFVHHPVPPADLHAFMARMPEDAYLGLRCIRLCLGGQRMEEHARRCPPDGDEVPPRDPHTGRLGSDIMVGVYSGSLLGSYHRDGALELYAYVLAPEVRHRQAIEFYLLAVGLRTFAHELAHHRDRMVRVARGTWRMDHMEKVEEYAETTEAEWYLEHVIPFLQEHRAKEVDAFLSWVEAYGGIRLPLRAALTMSRGILHYFEEFLGQVVEGAEPPRWHTLLARMLCYADMSIECLEACRRLLLVEPDGREPQMLKARSLLKMEQDAEAVAVTRNVLRSHPDDTEAWDLTFDGLIYSGNWDELRAAAETAEAIARSAAEDAANAELLRLALSAHIRAQVNLGRPEPVAPKIEAALRVSAGANSHVRERYTLELAAMEGELLLAKGEHAAAMDVAQSMLKDTKALRFVYGMALDACLLVAATRLGRWDLARSCLERRRQGQEPNRRLRKLHPRLFDVWVPECLVTLAAQGIHP